MYHSYILESHAYETVTYDHCGDLDNTSDSAIKPLRKPPKNRPPKKQPQKKKNQAQHISFPQSKWTLEDTHIRPHVH